MFGAFTVGLDSIVVDRSCVKFSRNITIVYFYLKSWQKDGNDEKRQISSLSHSH